MVWAPGTDFAEGGEKWVRGNGFSSDYEAAGTLTTTLTYRPIINSAFSGEGTLFTKGLHQTIRSAFSGTGTTTTSLDRPRLNLFTRPSAEGLGTAWIYNSTPNYYNNVTIELSSEQAYVGTQSYKLTSTRVGDVINYILMYSPLGTAAHPVVPGADYAVSYYAKAGTVGGKNLGVGLRFYDIDGNDIGTSGGFAATASLTAWNRVSAVYTAPGIAAYAAVQVYVGEVAVDEVYYIDGVMLEQSSTVKPYFDGSTTLAGRVNTWLGTAHNSVSRSAVQGAVTINSNYSGEGTLSTTGVHPVIRSAFSGEGSLTTAFHQNQAFSSLYSGEGTTSTVWSNYRNIYSDFSGEGSLSTEVFSGLLIRSSFSGTGHFSTKLDGLPVTITSAFSGEGVMTTEMGYVVAPAALGSAHLGKLSRFSVSTSAVPLNPADGSSSTPSVSASYTKGLDPEFMLGENNVLKNGAIGTYEGEVVKLSLEGASDVVSISMDTPLTLLNNELHLFPFIDGVPGLWTAARAIDYWTQQCGLFYDKVPGDVVAYASGFGHTDSYGASTTERFYEKLTGGTTSTTVRNGRSVKTLGTAVTGTTALHEVKDGNVPVSLPRDRKLVFSTGLGLAGAGRTGTVTWSFMSTAGVPCEVSLAATSEGTVTAKIDSTTVATASVPAGAQYRLALSLEILSATALVAKLTVHTDDLAGAGTLEHDGPVSVVSYALPGVLNLNAITHASAGGSGAQMVRWGTYLTVAAEHPLELPAVQKSLAQSTKPFEFVSGFEGNVWNMLAEFCAIARLDVRFLNRQLLVGPRATALTLPGGSFSRFSPSWERRDKYKQVALVNKQSKAVTTDDAVFWRADSVFQVAAREVFETTVQTDHSILNIVQPVAVNGIEPFPYVKGAGQYVVTGADGYIIAPAWWNDNGGKVEVSLTGKEGEIAIKITAPTQDTVRAPYRISEGAGDRPALYICGSGIVNDPVEVHVGTGAKNAKEGFDNVFESPFLAGVRETFDTAVEMAHQYSASHADVGFELPNSFETPTGFGEFPSGTLFTDNVRNYRVSDTSQTHSRVSGNAVPHTTIGAYVATYPEGATIADEKARHAGRTIRQFNIKPLKGA